MGAEHVEQGTVQEVDVYNRLDAFLELFGGRHSFGIPRFAAFLPRYVILYPLKYPL